MAVAAVLAAVAGRLPAPLAVAALAVTFLLTPGLLVARFAFARASREISAGSALALSPFLAGAPVAALLALGVPLPLAARSLAVTLALLALALPGTREREADSPGAWVSWTCAAAWMACMTALLAGNRWLPPRSDGWYHAAATLQVLDRGVPPEDPYFAGVRMLYFWGAHVWAAAWLALAPRLSVYTPLIAFNASASFAVVLAVAGLARRLGARGAGIGLAAGLATLGYSPFTWLLVAGRAALGHDRGWAELAGSLHGGAGRALEGLASGQLHASMAFFGDKFLVLTQFSMGLALFALAVAALLDLAGAPGPRTAIAFAALVAASLFTHTVVGYSVVLLSGLVWLSLVPGALRGVVPERRALLALPLAILCAAVPLSPYLVEITAGKRSLVHMGLSLSALLTLVVGGLFTVVPGFAWLARRAVWSPDAGRVLLIAAALALLGMALGLPESNQSKFFNLLFLLMAAPAALGWLEWMRDPRGARRTLLAVVLAAGALPTAALAAAGFAGERGQSDDGWRPPTPAMAAAMRWARANTPASAAFCDLGEGREILTLAGRSLLWGGFRGERDFGYDPAALLARRDLAGALCRGRDPGPAGAALLADFPRGIVVMTRAGAPDSLSDHGEIARRPARFRPLWANAEVAFWEVRRP